jgi:hypothetical protein
MRVILGEVFKIRRCHEILDLINYQFDRVT